ncbi:response regulator [Deinococcus sp. QL22]|uniref:response regulator n=1 Tax=Deinococcus sp. QL22 TaxID=2939437 RepID=UPI00201786E1|nr:response regulator [Deinococcus sp. QL22]UQN04906.1 response regulator [Deinococcus sp. QL22]
MAVDQWGEARIPLIRQVLIVEDSAADTLLLEMAFAEQAPDVEVHSVIDGTTAVARCLSSDPPQLVVLDMHLPGEAGWDVLASLRRNVGASLQVVCWSSHAHPDEVQAVLDQGALAYLEKPLGLTGFADLVDTILTL